MADEPTELDPLADMVTNHLARMAEIHQLGFEKSQQLCDESLTAIKRNSGVRRAVLDKALEQLGITHE